MTKMMKESVKTGHPTGLPEKLVRLFAPGPPLRFIAENAKPKKKPKLPYTGIGSLVAQFASPGDAEYEPPSAATSGELPQPRLFRNKELELQVRLDDETKLEKKKRLHDWKVEKNKKELEEKAATFNPADDPMIEGDAYKTLFVPRLSYEVTERKLRHEFEEFGPIKRIRLVHDRNTDKPRGYAFIEYEHKKDMKEAYKNADGRKVEGRRILVDVERGRTVDNWRPMRLGGGLGGDTRAAKEPRKKLMAEAAARGTTLPPAEAPIRYSGCCSACGRAGAGLAGAGLTLLRYSTGAEQLQIQCGVCSCCGLHVAQLFWVCRSVQVLGCGWLWCEAVAADSTVRGSRRGSCLHVFMREISWLQQSMQVERACCMWVLALCMWVVQLCSVLRGMCLRAVPKHTLDQRACCSAGCFETQPKNTSGWQQKVMRTQCS